MAGIRIDKIGAMKTAVRKLHALGHRRIVLMVQQEGIKPRFGLFEQTFMDELNALGIITGPYNLPDQPYQITGRQVPATDHFFSSSSIPLPIASPICM